MTKKTLCLFFSLLLALSLLSCETASLPKETDDTTQESNDTDTAESTAESTEEITEETTEEPPEPIDPNDRSYLELPCRETSGADDASFCFAGDRLMLTLTLPEAWTVAEDADGHLLLRDGAVIGFVQAGVAELSEERVVLETETLTNGRIRIEQSVIGTPAHNAEDRYSRRYVYRYTVGDVERAFTLEVGYTELDKFRSDKLLDVYTLTRTSDLLEPGSIHIAPEDAYKPILILGNSFISTSQIGAALQEMCNASESNQYEIHAISVGYATVSKTWDSYLDPIRYGQYAAVLMCGFYGTSDVTAFAAYVQACDESRTPLVILPAHNEGHGDTAAETYLDTHYINWKGEIDRLLSFGISWDSFCRDDTHKHSKPLAGYVGAHMIYRALFGEVPPISASYGSLSYAQIERTLGNYAESGFPPPPDDSVFYFKEP